MAILRRRPSAIDHTKAFVERASAEYDVELSFDEAGVRQLDQLARQFGYLSGDKRAAIEIEMADFVAEALRRELGGAWDRDASVYTLPNGAALNVGAWVAKRLRYGIGDSLHAKFRVAGQLANPRAEPEWDPSWPEDAEAAALLADQLGMSRAEAGAIDESLVAWLELRKATYINHGRGRIPEDDELDRLREELAAASASEDRIAAYALARRHKAHAWIQHWRFGNSLGGPSAYLVHYSERHSPRLAPDQFLAFMGYLGPTPQYREDLLLEMVWRVEKASRFRAQAELHTRREVSSILIRLVSQAHAWTATKHVKRLLDFLDLSDDVVVAELHDAQPEQWAEYWAVVKAILFCAESGKSQLGVGFGAEVLAWLDSTRGSSPTAVWHTRRQALLSEDPQAVEAITAWLYREGDEIRRMKDTGEVIEPISRWVKGARWHRQT